MSYNPDELLVLTAEYVDFAESALTKLAEEVLSPNNNQASVDNLINKYGQGTNTNYGGEGISPSQMSAQQLSQNPQDLGQLYRAQQISPQQYRDAIAIINKQEGGSDQTPQWGTLSPYGKPDTITGHAPKTNPNFNQKVKDLQIKLRDVYKLTGADGKPLKVDGLMGPNTRFAIQSYKTEYNMPQATDAMAIYNIMNTKPEEHAGRYTNTPNTEIERKNPFWLDLFSKKVYNSNQYFTNR